MESCYWRAELRRDLAWLKKHQKYLRWSEKQVVLFERKLMLVAFQVRSLLERPKVNDQARKSEMPAIRFKKMGNQPFTFIGAGWPEDRFELEKPEKTMLPIMSVCNQLIHYYWMQTYCENKSFSSLLVFSDYSRNNFAYQFEISEILKLFRIFGDNSSAVVRLSMVWSEKKQDYIIEEAIGKDDFRKE